MTSPASRLILATTALLLAASLGGCGASSPPRLSVGEVWPTERTNEGAALLFTINAENDNDHAVPLRTVEYSLDLDGRRVFSGTRSAEATLRRLGTQQFFLPAVVNLSDPANAGLATGRSRYRLTGQIYYVTPGRFAEELFDAGLRTPTEQFAFEGEVNFDESVPQDRPKP